MDIQRTLQKSIEKDFFQGKVIILYGARQVGKTTLVKNILKKFAQSVYLNCEEAEVKRFFLREILL